MNLVPVEKIPDKTDVVNIPDNLAEVYNVCLQMEEVCKKENGIGLSAVQVGIPWRLFVIKKDGKFKYMVNCEYEPTDDEKVVSNEGCLSLKKGDGSLRFFKVDRYKSVKISGKELVSEENLALENFEKTFEAKDIYFGIVYQHEIDHHNGILVSDIGTEIDIW